jgi:hypothetical protein
MLELFSGYWSTGATLVFGLLAVVLWPATVLVHELGHALVARLYGVDVEELVATPEGRAISVTIGGVPMRIGLGLKRERRSEEMAGWVKLRGAGLSARKERHILWAGPIAHGGFSILLLAIGGLAHLPNPVPLPLVASGACGLIDAVANVVRDGDGQTDGAQLRRIRRLPVPDPSDATSIPPPSTKAPS